jgi:hypothetical protein
MSQKTFRDCLKHITIRRSLTYKRVSHTVSPGECIELLRPFLRVRSLQSLVFQPPGVRNQLDEENFLTLWTSLTSLRALQLESRIFVSHDTLKQVSVRTGENTHQAGSNLGLVVDSD